MPPRLPLTHVCVYRRTPLPACPLHQEPLTADRLLPAALPLPRMAVTLNDGTVVEFATPVHPWVSMRRFLNDSGCVPLVRSQGIPIPQPGHRVNPQRYDTLHSVRTCCTPSIKQSPLLFARLVSCIQQRLLVLASGGGGGVVLGMLNHEKMLRANGCCVGLFMCVWLRAGCSGWL